MDEEEVGFRVVSLALSVVAGEGKARREKVRFKRREPCDDLAEPS